MEKAGGGNGVADDINNVGQAGYSIDNETSFSKEGVKKTITVSYSSNNKTKSTEYNVYVVSEAPSIVNSVVQVAVNKDYEGDVGTVVDGFNTFTTIQQALDYLECYKTTIDGKIGRASCRERV